MKQFANGVVFSFLAATVLCQEAEVVDAGEPNGFDDTQAISDILGGGHIVGLREGLTYRITSRLDVIKDGSGIITDGVVPATLRMLNTFDNFNAQQWPSTEDRPLANSTGIFAKQVDGLRFENFKLEKEHQDGTVVTGIWFREVQDSLLKDLEIYGFSLGSVVELGGVARVAVRSCTIRDCWANQAVLPDHLGGMPQLTGIMVDNNSDIKSNGLLIVNSTFRKLRFKQQLYDRPRSEYLGPTFTGPVTYQTDGVTLHYGGSGCRVIDNVFDVLGEAIDAFANNARIEGNRISNTHLFGVKLVHGASNALVLENSIHASRFAAVTCAGSAGADWAKDTFFNFVQRNTFSGSGMWTAFQQGIADSGFEIAGPGYGGPFPCVVWITRNWPANPPALRFRVRVNTFLDNTTNFNPSTDTLTNLFDIGSDCEDVTFLSDWVNANLNVHIDPNTIFCGVFNDAAVGGPVDAVQGDFDGNGLSDVFMLWAGSGYNRLYHQEPGQQQERTHDSIARTSINGVPDILRSGDFNGDSKDDLFWCWKQTGENRIAFGTDTGFTLAVSNPIAPLGINGTEDVIVGNFDGLGGDDILFYWKQSGTNRFAFGSANDPFTFSVVADPIPAAAINGSPDHVVKGNFDGAGGDDLLFHWNGSGDNRFFFFNTSIGGFVPVVNPIPAQSVNGGPVTVRAFDADFDGRDDVNFFWTTSELRRLFLAQPNGGFVPD